MEQLLTHRYQRYQMKYQGHPKQKLNAVLHLYPLCVKATLTLNCLSATPY